MVTATAHSLFGTAPTARVGVDERRSLRTLAHRILRQQPMLAASGRSSPGVGRGCDGALLLFDDRIEPQTAGPQTAGETGWSHRSLLLAGDGDIVLSGGTLDPDFADYCRDRLALGSPAVFAPTTGGRLRPETSLFGRCRDEPAVLDRLAAWARTRGRVTLVPFIGGPRAWALAEAIAARSWAAVTVAAATPPLTASVNDTLWFSQRVAELFGPGAVPPAWVVWGPEALASGVAALARRHPWLVIRQPTAPEPRAGVRLPTEALVRLDEDQLMATVQASLAGAGWRGAFPLILSVWESDQLACPVVHLWVPEPDRDPTVQGILLERPGRPEGDARAWVPSDLPEPWNRRLADDAVRFGCLLQELGYFGRCTLGAAIIGPSLATGDLRWTGCTGRWDDVSVALTLANRLTGDWTRRAFAVINRVRPPPRAIRLPHLLDRLQDRLFHADQGGAGCVLLAPPGGSGAGFQLMSIGVPVAEAERTAEIGCQMGEESRRPVPLRTGYAIDPGSVQAGLLAGPALD